MVSLLLLLLLLVLCCCGGDFEMEQFQNQGTKKRVYFRALAVQWGIEANEQTERRAGKEKEESLGNESRGCD